MSSTPLRLTVGAIAIAALTLAACSSGSDSSENAAGTNTPAASAPTTPEPTASTATPESPAEADPVVGDGGQCAIGTPGVKAIVVQGSIDCGTLDSVWTRAVADPNFATHGNRNTIVVDDWTCRAHQVTPIATGFCEDAGYQNKFKIVHAG